MKYYFVQFDEIFKAFLFMNNKCECSIIQIIRYERVSLKLTIFNIHWYKLFAEADVFGPIK